MFLAWTKHSYSASGTRSESGKDFSWWNASCVDEPPILLSPGMIILVQSLPAANPSSYNFKWNLHFSRKVSRMTYTVFHYNQIRIYLYMKAKYWSIISFSLFWLLIIVVMVCWLFNSYIDTSNGIRSVKNALIFIRFAHNHMILRHIGEKFKAHKRVHREYLMDMGTQL